MSNYVTLPGSIYLALTLGPDVARRIAQSYFL
jgi:hypothetical protein